MTLGRRALGCLPVSGRILRTIDGLRAERDRLRADRDGLREGHVALRAERDQLRIRLAAAEATPTQPLEGGDAAEPPHSLCAPSFLARTENLRRVRNTSRQLHGYADPVWAYNDKGSGGALARRLGLVTPAVLAPPGPLAQLEPPAARCVIKPVEGSSARGVAALVATEGGRWLDLLDLEAGARPWATIQRELEGLVATGRISEEFLAEELVAGPTPLSLPYDWKLLCVGGEVVLAYGRHGRSRRGPRDARFRYFSPDWEDLGAIHKPRQIDPTIPRPHDPAGLVSAAEAIARALPTPFIRVDLYDTPEGVVFGELTPQPGNALWFGRELDRAIGEVWDRAEAASWRR
jgi:hypothetical protein